MNKKFAAAALLATGLTACSESYEGPDIKDVDAFLKNHMQRLADNGQTLKELPGQYIVMAGADGKHLGAVFVQSVIQGDTPEHVAPIMKCSLVTKTHFG